ncbi:MAG: hypothetical protein WC824_11140, partial [Bacteroidota bacterium]
MMKHFFTLLLCSVLIANVAYAQDAAYRYEKGKEYKYLIEETSLTMQEMPGQTISINNETTISAVYTVLENLENGNLKLQGTILNALVISENPNETKTLGNDMIGKSVVFEMEPRGEVVDIDSSIRKIDSEGVGILISATNIFPKLDASNLKVGGSWSTNESDTTGEGDNGIIEETERNYQVKGEKTVDGVDCLEIETTSDSNIEGKMVRGDQEMMITGSRKGKGTIMYGVKEGILVGVAAEINVDQVIVLPANNMRIPITATRNI